MLHYTFLYNGNCQLSQISKPLYLKRAIGGSLCIKGHHVELHPEISGIRGNKYQLFCRGLRVDLWNAWLLSRWWRHVAEMRMRISRVCIRDQWVRFRSKCCMEYSRMWVSGPRSNIESHGLTPQLPRNLLSRFIIYIYNIPGSYTTPYHGSAMLSDGCAITLRVIPLRCRAPNRYKQMPLLTW